VCCIRENFAGTKSTFLTYTLAFIIAFMFYAIIFVLQAVSNFVMYKFGHLPQNEWHTMYELAKMFLHCVNHWRLETPSNHAKSVTNGDNAVAQIYRENYTRFV